MNIRIDISTLRRITNVNQERNIYVHPNPLARDIFWQRLERLFHYITKYAQTDSLVLDFGGGSGVFAKALCGFFDNVELLDLDTSCAEKIQKEFKLDNLTIASCDIKSFVPEHKYNVIIAADVLEHFRELSVPVKFIHSNLEENGLLTVSVPTENKLYEIGRTIIRKDKPADHYHSSADVIQFVSTHGFSVVTKSYVPRYLLPVPLFEIVVFAKSSSQHSGAP